MSFKNVKHVVIDLEALGGLADADCIITAISAVVIDGRQLGETYEQILERTQFWKLSIKDQEYTRTSQPDTVAWWEKQAHDVKLQCYLPDLERDMSPRDVLTGLNRYLTLMGVNDKTSIVWSRGTAYDIPKLLSLYEECGVSPVFSTWNVADTKTAFLCRSNGTTNVFGLGGNPKGFRKHNALHDTALEAFKLVQFFKEESDFKTVKQKVESGELPDQNLLSGEEYEKFKGIVLESIKSGSIYTKHLNEAVNNSGMDLKGTVVRSNLYKMQSEGLILSAKLGQYPQWQLVVK